MIDGLIALLAAENTITTYVSSRIYANYAPEKAPFPYIVITQLNSEEYKAFDATGDLRMITYDIDCKAERALTAIAVADAVRTYIQDYSGTAGNYTIEAVLLNGETHDFEPPSDGSDRGVHVVTLDLDVQYNP
jgi:hypothetical protein